MGVVGLDPANGLAQVGRLLVGVVDDLGGCGLGGVEVADGSVQRVEVADDDLEVGKLALKGGEIVQAVRAAVSSDS
jgi:hypothetical protein